MNDGKGNVCFRIQVTIPLDYPHSLCSIRCSAPFSQTGLAALLTSARNQAPLSSIGRSAPLNSIRISEPPNPMVAYMPLAAELAVLLSHTVL